MAATRWHTAVLLGVLLVGLGAVVQLGREPYLQDTCADPEAFFDAAALPFASENLKIDFGKGKLRIDGFLSGAARGEAPMPFTMRRTYFLPEWIIRPTRAVPGPPEPDRFERRTLDVDGEAVPVVFAYEMKRARQRFAAFLFEYDREPVRHPFWARLFGTPFALLDGSPPVTYMGVAAVGDPRTIPSLERRAEEWLVTAWRHYRKTCTPGRPRGR